MNYEKILNELKKTIINEAKKLTSYKTDAKTTKVWILPDGKIQYLKEWHYSWILQNAPRLKKEYKLDLTGIQKTEHFVRLAAIKAGFFRVNYSHNGGVLTVEGHFRKFNKRVKDAVFMITADNANQVDRIFIALVDDDGNVKKSKETESQFMMMNKQQKLDSIPLVSESVKKRYAELL